MAKQTVQVVANLQAREDGIEDLQKALMDAIPNTRKEKGCLRYDLFQNTAKASQFTLLEEWSDNQCLAAHLNAPAFKALSEELANLLAAAPEIKVYKRIM